MNLLKDAWVPVQRQGKRQMIRLQDVLYGDEEWQLSLPRDDMEMASLQLMICLTQVIFTPEDARALKQRIRQPLTENEYQDGVANYLDWFELNHPETPFMQVRGVKAADATPIQKLFVGLPEGKNHAFFNDAGEITAVSESAAAIALFNQAMNSPSMGGGFKGGFRGGAPITTLISGETLRQSVWFNVLHEDSLREIMPRYDHLKENDKPTWVEPIKARSSIAAHDIGLLRGLFWQPAHIELDFTDAGQCQFYGTDEAVLVTSFKKEKFGGKSSGGFDLVGMWVHPHSPRHWQIRNGGTKEERYESFRTTAPAWSQLTMFILDKIGQEEGYQTASAIRQFKRVFPNKQANLLVGGYRADKAAIRQRRHELLPLKEGWTEHSSELSQVIDVALNIKQQLIKSLCLFGILAGAAKRNRRKNKAITPDGVLKYKECIEEYPYKNFEEFFDGIHMKAEPQFYHSSEHLIHKALRQLDWRHSLQERQKLAGELMKISWNAFNQATKPYQHEPKMIHALAVAKRSMNTGFNKIKGGLV